MEKFNIKCPDHYPMKCNLSPADKDYLSTSEKYKAFFIFQYKGQDEWLMSTIEKYFSERSWRLFNAGKEKGTGTKFCNVCRYALASDFGIVSLTPFNYNVFQEIGLMQGLQKQLLYILNPKRLEDKDIKKLPFDIDDQIYIEHSDKKALVSGLDNKTPLILDKIQLLSRFESSQREHIKSKLDKLSVDAKGLLKLLLLEGTEKFINTRVNTLDLWVTRQTPFSLDCLTELHNHRFIIEEVMSAGSRPVSYNQLNESYRKHLEELLWEH